MKVNLAYGQGYLPVELPDGRTTVIQPLHTPGLADERGAVLAALAKPIARPPVAGVAEARRPRLHCFHRHHPRHAQRPPDSLAAELPGRCPAREHHLAQRPRHASPQYPAELEQLLTPAVVQDYRVLNHEAENPDALIPSARRATAPRPCLTATSSRPMCVSSRASLSRISSPASAAAPKASCPAWPACDRHEQSRRQQSQ